MPPLRVLHVPHNVGGNPQGLAEAERELGLASWCVSYAQTYRAYRADETLLRGDEPFPVREARKWRLVARAAREFDVVHFNSGRSMLPQLPEPLEEYEVARHPLLRRAHRLYAETLRMRDLALLRRAGKVLAVTYQGDEARQGSRWGDMPERFEVALSELVPRYTRGSDAAKARMIELFDRHAHRIYYLNPDLSAFLPARATFMPYASVDPRVWTPQPLDLRPDEPLRIVHSPSTGQVRGTDEIVAAIDRLRDEGVPLEFTLVEGVSHEEARRLYERAHLLVDQLLLGWYGAIAVEFMALGKPVVCHIRERDLDVIPREMRDDLPVIRATRESVYDVLREWSTTRRHELRDLGLRSREYASRWHDPLRIAATLKRDYEESAATRSSRSLS